MCQGCWTDSCGASTALPEGWEVIVALINELYDQPYCGSGGPLHVELDDFNVNLEWRPYQADYPPEAMRIAEQIGVFMRPLPVAQRAAVVAKWSGYF